WIGVNDGGVRWLKDGSFLWMSDRNGWTHVYHYASDGKVIAQVTKGEWDVRGMVGVDEEKGTLYFGSTEHSYIGSQEYGIKFDVSGMTRLTSTEGAHRASFNSTATHFVDSWSDVNTPTQVRLYDANGKFVRVIDENKVEALSQYKLGKVELLNVKT